MPAWLTTTDGIDILVVSAVRIKDEQGRSKLKCICKIRPELKDELLKMGKLRLSDISKDNTFIRVWNEEKFQQLGIVTRIPRIFLNANFDGTDATIMKQWGMEKDKVIASLEEDVKFWKGKAAIEHERALKANLEVSETIKQDFEVKYEPVRTFIKKSAPFWMGMQRYRPTRSFSPPQMPEGTEEEYV